ncbi:helix-turn-helix domain-containing protein [Rothia amarae]|uniref:helix-turn-helix domain-containing protein n=1 Tax=Rothia amarae TaxID=169480 RepID=UPI0031D33D80
MPPVEEHRIRCHLEHLLEEKELTLVELSTLVGISVANLSILKNNRAKAVRFSTLTALCEVLECTPGELFGLDKD